MDIKSIDVKDKLIVIKSDNLDHNNMVDIRKKMFEKGCLGVIGLDVDSSLESLGIKQLEDLLENLRARTVRASDDETKG